MQLERDRRLPAVAFNPVKFSYEITDEDKAEFIDLLYAGLKANQAATEIGTTGTQMRRLKNPRGCHYDEQFARAWLEAEASEEHRANREEELRALIDERSKHSDAILIKRMISELPEYAVLRHQNFNVNVDIVARALPGLSLDELERIRAALERGEQEPAVLRALPKPS